MSNAKPTQLPARPPVTDVAPKPKLAAVPVDRIDARGRLRTLDPNWVAALAENIADVGGLQTPIEVVETAEGFRLVYGAHRLAAAKRLEWPTIPAVVMSAPAMAGEAALRLREVAENLMRRELSVLDRATHVAAWREIYEAVRGAVKPGRKSNSRKLATISPTDLDAASEAFAASFTDAARAALKLSKDGVFRALKIASIAPELRDRIAAHPIAENQSELLTLAGETPARQASIVALLVADEPRASTVAEAIAIIDKLPPPEKLAPFERLADGFARLKPAERDRFFELHAEDIEAWIARRHNAETGGGRLDEH